MTHVLKLTPLQLKNLFIRTQVEFRVRCFQQDCIASNTIDQKIFGSKVLHLLLPIHMFGYETRCSFKPFYSME